VEKDTERLAAVLLRIGVSSQSEAELVTLGIQAFMAHEHIEVSMQWRDEILRQIELADLFVPILSQRY